MASHELKIDPELFKDVRAQRKTAEVRLDDRDYQVGDTLIFAPFDRAAGEFTGPDFCCREVTHKVEGGQYGIEEGYCLLSMK